MKEITTFGTNVKMTSLDIAAITGKRHDHVIRDIRQEIEKLKDIEPCIFELSQYKDLAGKNRPCFSLSLKGVLQLVTKYNSQIRYKVFSVIERDCQNIYNAIKNIEIPEDLPLLYVYAIKEHDTGNIKIGISKDPERRLNQLQIGNSSRLSIIYRCEATNRYKDEKIKHEKCNAYHIHGEWFQSTATEVL